MRITATDSISKLSAVVVLELLGQVKATALSWQNASESLQFFVGEPLQWAGVVTAVPTDAKINLTYALSSVAPTWISISGAGISSSTSYASGTFTF